MNLNSPLTQPSTKKRLSILAVTLAASCMTASAVTVIVGSGGGPKFRTSADAPAMTGWAVRTGAIDPGDVATFGSSNNFAALDALFRPLAEGVAGAGTLNQPGNATTRAIINDTPAAGDFSATYSVSNTGGQVAAGDKLYLWVFNNADPSLATEWGVYTGGAAFDVPANDALGQAIAINLNVTTAVRGSLSGGNLLMAPIPEPSAALLALLAGAFACLRRRR